MNDATTSQHKSQIIKKELTHNIQHLLQLLEVNFLYAQTESSTFHNLHYYKVLLMRLARRERHER